MSVVGVAASCASDVEESRAEKFCSRHCSTVAKGRYLLGFSGILVVPLVVVPFCERASGDVVCGVGYRNSARCVCEAITQTSLPFPEARCAFMKMRRLAMQADNGRVDDRCAHACGLESRTTARSDGGGPWGMC